MAILHDCKVLNYIKNTLGFGTVNLAGDGYWTYVVSAKSEILILIHLFNGNLLLQKTNSRFVSEWLQRSWGFARQNKTL